MKEIFTDILISNFYLLRRIDTSIQATMVIVNKTNNLSLYYTFFFTLWTRVPKYLQKSSCDLTHNFSAHGIYIIIKFHTTVCQLLYMHAMKCGIITREWPVAPLHYCTYGVVVQHSLLFVDTEPSWLPTLEWVSPLLQLALQRTGHGRVLSLLVKVLTKREMKTMTTCACVCVCAYK